MASSKSNDGWKDEAYKAFVKRWRAEQEAESERRRQKGQISIWLESAADDVAVFTHDGQNELHDIVGKLGKEELDLNAPFLAVDSIDAVSGYTGQLIIPLIKAASPIMIAVLVAWLKRPGRKVRVEFHPNGKTKTIEAENAEQVLSIAKALDEESKAPIKND